MALPCLQSPAPFSPLSLLQAIKQLHFFFTIIKSSFQLLGHFKFSPIGFVFFYAALSVLLNFSCSVHALTHYHRTSATSQLITVMPYMIHDYWTLYGKKGTVWICYLNYEQSQACARWQIKYIKSMCYTTT